MRVFSASIQAALEAQTLVTRDFMRITGRVRATGAPITESFWSDFGDITAPVINPDTGAEVNYTFYGAGELVAMDPIPLVSNLTVQKVTVTFSQLDTRINELLRVYSVRQARVEIYRGIFDPVTRLLVEAAFPRFVGFVDGAPVETPAENGAGSVQFECVSHIQELTRSNPDTRSHDSQIARAPGDAFYQDVTSVGDLVIYWGRASGTVGE